MVFQDPLASLNPVFTIGNQISRVVRVHKKVSHGEALEATRRALASAGLRPDDALLDSYPHQLSGGMRQRACMAMALSCDAPLLIADEPTTALDVTIQAQMLRLLLDLRDDLGIAQILITHNVGVAAQTCDRVAVMYAGERGRAGHDRRGAQALPSPVHDGALRVPASRQEGVRAAHDPGLGARPHRPARRLSLSTRAARTRWRSARPSSPTRRALSEEHWVACHWAAEQAGRRAKRVAS